MRGGAGIAALQGGRRVRHQQAAVAGVSGRGEGVSANRHSRRGVGGQSRLAGQGVGETGGEKDGGVVDQRFAVAEGAGQGRARLLEGHRGAGCRRPHRCREPDLRDSCGRLGIDPAREEVGQGRRGIPSAAGRGHVYVSKLSRRRSLLNAIRHMANSDDESQWTAAERAMVEHFQRFGNRELVGKSDAIQNLLGQINLIASKECTRVLIYGESGTGKETVALQIHNKSSRHNEPFIAFNCANVSLELLESRFLGHEKGAFTGAIDTKPGVFEQADGGTLFLDEIGELPLAAQGLLLRVLEGGRFTRVGEKKEVVVNVRLMAATHRDLAAMVRESKFREDLFFRLNVIQIRVPPLREHKEDIGQIADGFWLKRCGRRLHPAQIEALMAYDYPGNVRELINLLERANVLEIADFSRLMDDHRKTTGQLKPPQDAPEAPDHLEEMVRWHVRRVYDKCGKNLTKTAETLGAARNTVRKYLGKGIEE